MIKTSNFKLPRIGITFDKEEPSETGYSKFPWYALRLNYVNSVIKAGGIPIILPHEVSLIQEYSNIIDGLIVTGGNFDIDPKLYGDQSKYENIRSNGTKKSLYGIKSLVTLANIIDPGALKGKKGSLLRDVSQLFERPPSTISSKARKPIYFEGHVASGHLEWEGGRLRLTSAGLMVADSIIVDLL